MATTRLMPLHIGKGQTAGDAIKRALGYIKDPMKTENGILVTSYGCTPQTAEAEFMLMRREYLTITGRRRGKQVFFENAHEAIVDRQAWEKAHEAFEKPKRAKAENADSNFKDFVFCARCGAPMNNLHHAQHLKTGTICYYDFFICSTYRKSEHLEERQCVQNAFSAKALRPLLKETIQTVSRYALTNQEEFLARLQREMLAEQPEQTKQLKKRIAAKNKRVAELDRLLKKTL